MDPAYQPYPPPPPAPQQPVARTHRWGLWAFVLVEATFLAVSYLLALLVGDGALGASTLALAIVVPTMAAAALAVLITKLRGNGPKIDLELSWSWRQVGIGAAFGFGGLFVTLPASFAYVTLVGPDANSAVGQIFTDVRSTVPLALLVFVVLVFLVPLFEEIIFRGLLWGALDKHWGRRVALVVSTIVFALGHFELTRAPLLLIVAIPIGLARYYGGGLLASVVAHQANNLLPGLVVALGLLGAMPT